MVRYAGGERRNRLVRVPGRADVGEVVSEGVNIGQTYCVAIKFDTGEVAYYEKGREVDVPDD